MKNSFLQNKQQIDELCIVLKSRTALLYTMCEYLRTQLTDTENFAYNISKGFGDEVLNCHEKIIEIQRLISGSVYEDEERTK